MATFSTPIAQAEGFLRTGDLAGAEMLCRQFLETAPGDAGALVTLGRALTGQAKFSDAVACFGAVLGVDPGHGEARFHLGIALHVYGMELAGRGQLDQAAVCFQQALQFNPGEAETHFQWGELLRAQGKREEAIIQFEKAVGHDPECIDALLKLGTLHAQVNEVEPASKWFRWALAIDPDLEEANFNLAALLEGEARLAEAQIHRNRVPRPMPLSVETAPDPRLRVLIPWGAGSGNVPIDTLMPRATTTRIKWLVECATDEQEAELPPHDLVFNGIGNADIAGFSLERLTRFQAGHPMLNPPDKVMRTRRDLMPDLLAGIPDMVVPRVLRLRRDEVRDGGLVSRLGAAGFAFPLLVRPIGTQGGHGAMRVDAPEHLPQAVASDADAFYFIEFHDNRCPDGHYRKYRMVYVDRVPYPYHLAISQDWLVHYYSAKMLAAPFKREEERRFLEDPAAVLGPSAYAAIEAIGRRMDLDYAGVDFSVLPDGRILVFEANATMLAHLDESPEDYPYKFVAVPKIFRAFEAMLDRARS